MLDNADHNAMIISTMRLNVVGAKKWVLGRYKYTRAYNNHRVVSPGQHKDIQDRTLLLENNGRFYPPLGNLCQGAECHRMCT